VVKLRYSLAHIYYTIHHHLLKIAKKILSLTVPNVVILSLSKKIQCRRGMGYAKICEEIKRSKCPEPRKRKKKSETRGKNGQVSGVELGVQRCPLERTNGQVSDSRIRGVYYPPEKKEKT